MDGSLSVLLWITILFEDNDAQVINIPTSAMGVNGVSEFILFTDKRRWNTARRVCKSIGANLARLDTLELLQKVETASDNNNPWDDDWGHVWTGLHRETDDNLIFEENDGCSPFDVSVSGLDVFKDSNDYNEIDDKNCHQIDSGSYTLEKKNCDELKMFICERKSGTCLYNSIGSSANIVAQPNATGASCQSVCSLQSGCFLAGNYFNSHCVLLTAPAGSNVMFEKICDPVFSVNTSDTSSYHKPGDVTNIPIECNIITGPLLTSSSVQSELTSTVPIDDICPSSHIYTSTSLLECSSEFIIASPSVVNVTVTDTSTQISTTTVTVTGTITTTDAVTQIISVVPSVKVVTVTDTSMASQTTTVTATEVLSTCKDVQLTTSLESPCVINTQVLVTQMTSTFLMTSILDCPSTDLGHLTITPSCPEASIQLQPTTLTFYERTSCLCNSSQSIPVIAPAVTDDSYQTTVCKAYNITTTEMVAIDAILESIVKRLTLDTKNLSKTVREKTSAPDPRPSSMSIGFSAISLTIIPFLVILLIDVQRIVEDIRKSFISIKHTGDPKI